MLVSPILGYMRANNSSIDDLRVKANEVLNDGEILRSYAFLKVLEPISVAYANHLKEQGCIDFDEMIGRAIDYAQTSEYISPYTHILVDEFQDISQARATLVKALVGQRDDTTFFCVGRQ